LDIIHLSKAVEPGFTGSLEDRIGFEATLPLSDEALDFIGDNISLRAVSYNTGTFGAIFDTATFVDVSGTGEWDTISTTSLIPGDANADRRVDISDLGILATNWQLDGLWTAGDFNYDGFIDISDLGLLATNWQVGVSAPAGLMSFDAALAALGLPAASVPEPNSMISISATCIWLRAFRRGPRERPLRLALCSVQEPTRVVPLALWAVRLALRSLQQANRCVQKPNRCIRKANRSFHKANRFPTVGAAVPDLRSPRVRCERHGRGARGTRFQQSNGRRQSPISDV
jgi:hypothetical protein